MKLTPHVNIGEKEDIFVGVNRGLKDRTCDVCKGKIIGGGYFADLSLKGEPFLLSHLQCMVRLSAITELFVEVLEKHDSPPAIEHEKHDSTPAIENKVKEKHPESAYVPGQPYWRED